MPIGNATLEIYEPLQMSLIVQVFNVTRTPGGLELGQAKRDKWFKIVKTADGLSGFEVGDYVLANPQSGIPLEFEQDDNNYIQFATHAVMGVIKAKDVEEVEERTFEINGKPSIISS